MGTRKYEPASTIFNANFQVGMAAPLDNRDVVRRYAHLISGIGLNRYMGEIVYVTGEYVAAEDEDTQEWVAQNVDENGIVQSEVGYYYYKNDTDGWTKLLVIEDGGSGGGSNAEIPTDVLPIGVANGIAPLDGNALVPAEFLPSYVDDIIEGYAYIEGVEPNEHLVFYTTTEKTTTISGERGKVYIDLLTQKTYRWSGSVFVEVSNSQISRSFTTNIAVGGIAKGTTISTNDSLEDVLKKILVNVYQPVIKTNAKATITKTAGSNVIKIGSKELTFTFKIEGDRGKVSLDGVEQGAYAGAMSSFKLYMNGTNVKSVASSSSPQSISVLVDANKTFTDGTNNIEIDSSTITTSSEQIITFKGGVYFAEGTKYNDSAGSPSTLAKFTEQELQSTELSIEIVCPVFANTNASSVGTTIEQSVVSKASIRSGLELTLPKHKLVESGGSVDWENSTPYCFEIPASWNLSKVYWYNPQTLGWEDYSLRFVEKVTMVNDTPTTTHVKTINGVNVSYKTYYYNIVSPNIDTNKFKIIIS